jgi:hypothetical protein
VDFSDLDAAFPVMDPFGLYQVADSLCGIEIEGIKPIIFRTVNNSLSSNLVVTCAVSDRPRKCERSQIDAQWKFQDMGRWIHYDSRSCF